MPCVRPPDNNQKLGGFLFFLKIFYKTLGIIKKIYYICTSFNVRS